MNCINNWVNWLRIYFRKIHKKDFTGKENIMSCRSVKKSLIIIFSILLTAGILIIPPFSSLILRFLSRTEKVEANVLLVEGWLPDFALDVAANEYSNNSYDLILTTGNIIPDSYYTMYGSGYLTFYLENLTAARNDAKQHKIEVEAYSELEGENCAHFYFYVNDSICADFYADKKERKYGINWKGDISEIDSVTIHFDNDKWGEWGDRNLFVKEIIIDNKLHFPYLHNSKYDYLDMDGKDIIIFKYNSYAELAKNKLINIGIDAGSITAIPGERTAINRTLKSAKAFQVWLKESNLKVKGINIVSLGSHAQRTWMVYRKVLGNQYKTGIISVSDYENNLAEKYNIMTPLREILGIIYYWFILIPYYF